MRRLARFALVLAVVAMAASPVLAQRPPGGFGGFGGFDTDQLTLLTQKSVQDELKLSEDQVKKITELAEKQRISLRDSRKLSREEMQKKREELAKANDKAVAEILKANQLKRVKQITLQQRGAESFGDAEVIEALKVTKEQKDKIKTIEEDIQKDMRGLFQGGNWQEGLKKMEGLRKETTEKLLKVLTDDQKAKWKELIGEPFKGEIRQRGFGGGFPAGEDFRRSFQPAEPGPVPDDKGGSRLAGPAGLSQQPDPKRADLEKRLDRLLKEMEDVRRELGQDKPDTKRAEQIDKARAEVKKQVADIEKLQNQLREAYSRLQKAQDQLDELEGRRRSPGDMRGGPWDWRDRMARPVIEPQQRGDARPADLERRLDRLLQEMEDIRRELRRERP